jgi:hypothetical protein
MNPEQTGEIFRLDVRATPNEPHANGKFMSHTTKTALRSLMRDATKFKQYGSRLDHGNPTIRLAFAFTHSGFQRSSCHRLLREDSDEHLALTTNVLIRSNAAGFNRLTSHVTGVK